MSERRKKPLSNTDSEKKWQCAIKIIKRSGFLSFRAVVQIVTIQKSLLIPTEAEQTKKIGHPRIQYHAVNTEQKDHSDGCCDSESVSQSTLGEKDPKQSHQNRVNKRTTVLLFQQPNGNRMNLAFGVQLC